MPLPPNALAELQRDHSRNQREQRNDWLDRELSREYPMILQAWLTLPSCLASS
jgi:hypothetical protein